MRKAAWPAAGLVAALALGGCNTPQDYNAARGAVVGGTTGALIGGLASGRPGGALVGGAIGAASGAVLGAAATPLPPPPVEPGPIAGRPCARWGDDGYGNNVCLKLAGY